MNRPLITPTTLAGVVVVEPHRFEDDRGFFCEVYNARALAALGLNVGFVQDNQSMSELAGTVRGLHYQSPPHEQAKLVRCGQGAIWDVAVDFRKNSDTYGQWVGCELSSENGRQLFVPAGFLHGFVTLKPKTEVLYKCTTHYEPSADGVIAWDSVGIDWPLEGRVPTLSDKDMDAIAFSEVVSPFGGGV